MELVEDKAVVVEVVTMAEAVVATGPEVMMQEEEVVEVLHTALVQ